MFRRRALPILIWAVYSALRATWRVRIREPEALRAALDQNRSVVFAHWHGDELALLAIIRKYRAAVMTSTSKDGELMTAVLERMGVRASRGSSTRGGATALKGIIRLAREGFNPSVAVDGPKGPYRRVKPGVFEISRVTEGEIYVAACACDRAFTFKKSWNKTFLPLPFSRVEIVFSGPFPAVGRDEDPRSFARAEALEKALADAGQQAVHLLAAP